MYSNYDADELMNSFDQWREKDKRDRFMKRMQHKFDAKEGRHSR